MSIQNATPLSVTDTTASNLETVTRRNALATAEAEISTALGTAARERTPEERARWQRAYEAERTASHCSACGQAFGADVIYRAALHFGRIVPLCAGCVPPEIPQVREYLESQACGHCDRPVAIQIDRRCRRRVVCSAQCRAAVEVAFRRALRTNGRQSRAVTHCVRCGGAMDTKRADAQHCTAACRQAAYRQRVACAQGTTATTPSWGRSR